MLNTTLCYIEQDDAYLLLHRVKKENDLNQGKWIAPGGKFQEGESPEDCVLREVKEETGLTLTAYRYRGVVTFVSDCWEGELMHLFTADGFDGTLTDCDEGVLKWVRKSVFAALPQWDGDRIFLDLLERGAPFFSLKLCYTGETLTAAVLDGRPLSLPYAPAALAAVRTMRVIARVRSDFDEKFGIPRQSGLVDALRAQVVFEPPFRNENALRGIEGFSHLWLLWEFSECSGHAWSPTVRPPRLGGNTRMGVFATRAPYRPNPIGLSCVRLLSVRRDAAEGPVLEIAGADLMDGTPIFDIKPYIPYADCIPDASGGFAQKAPGAALTVDFPAALLSRVPAEKRAALCAVLAEDPRPRYQDDPARVYGMRFAGQNIRFFVRDGVLSVTDVEAE